MKNFRIVPLPGDVAEAARCHAKAGAADHTVLVADSANAYPCRECLRWARPGQEVILFPYTSVPRGRPYSETGPIFIHAKTCQPYVATDSYPSEFRSHRVLRAYDKNDAMIDAVVVNDEQPEDVIERLLQKSETAYLQARSVTRGCYTFRIERS